MNMLSAMFSISEINNLFFQEIFNATYLLSEYTGILDVCTECSATLARQWFNRLGGGLMI